ncbi:CLUMA_CG009158, isoform A [Clunio marinus]|uniref:CLUMA_CG009158, isoform A n=1 Tax=Clunio marinus TaxID=568069 RepID=A0A1J1I7Z5_9DIPT|nr:CLUMA_CG009158, isoform A [Clunio marinus]
MTSLNEVHRKQKQTNVKVFTHIIKFKQTLISERQSKEKENHKTPEKKNIQNWSLLHIQQVSDNLFPNKPEP